MPELSKPLKAALNEQIERELASAYLYLEMSMRCAARSLKGAAHWMRMQWEEELAHATKLIDYVIDRDGTPELAALAKPQFEFDTLTGLFEQVLAHEQEVTASIYRLFEQARNENDYATQTFLQWFINEQVEEENSVRDVLDSLKVGGEEGTALLMVDRELGSRVAETGGTE